MSDSTSRTHTEPTATLRALLAVYVDNDAKWEAGKSALSAVEAQLETLQQERDRLQRAFNTEVRVCQGRTRLLQRAEAREALRDALREIAECRGIERARNIANRAVALDGQEEHQR